MNAEVTRIGTLDMQVCVPEDWTDEQALAYAERVNPCGTTHGWRVRKAGDELLAGSPERAVCLGRAGMAHLTLDC